MNYCKHGKKERKQEKKTKQQSKAADLEYQNLFLCLIRKKELSNKNELVWSLSLFIPMSFNNYKYFLRKLKTNNLKNIYLLSIWGYFLYLRFKIMLRTFLPAVKFVFPNPHLIGRHLKGPVKYLSR